MAAFFQPQQLELCELIVRMCNIKVALLNAHERNDHTSVIHLVTQYYQVCIDIINTQSDLILRLQHLYDSQQPHGTANTDRTPD